MTTKSGKPITLKELVSGKVTEKALSALSFEEGLSLLSELTEEMESGALPLEESLNAYSEGVKVSKRLEAILTGAEKKLEVLRGGEDESA